MSKQSYTYNVTKIIRTLLIWEVIFWGLYIALIFTLGFFNDDPHGEVLLYKYPARFFWALLLIPVYGTFFFFIRKANERGEKLPARVRESYLKPVSSSYTAFKLVLFRNVLIFLIIAFANPVFGKKKSAATVENLELVVCLDVSNSMNAKDISKEISRLDISKRAMIQLVNNLHGERIGICLFANNAYVQLPITRDYGAAKLFINDIESDLVRNQGTNIKEALEVSMSMFSKERTGKGVILVTDGENHETNPSAILKKIKESKVELIVLGIGTSQGGLVPEDPHRPDLGYKTTATGKKVISKLNTKFIESIAAKAGGKASISSDEFPDLSALLTEINHLKRTKIDNFEFDIKQDRYQYPLVLALFFWIMYLLWSERTSDRLNRMIAPK